MKTKLYLLTAALAFTLGGCTSAPKPPAAKQDLTLETLNPRIDSSPRDQYITTVYLIRNTTQKCLTITGGPSYSWESLGMGLGGAGPSTLVGAKATSTLYFGTGYAKDYQLQPGESFPFISQTYFGPSDEYPMSVCLFQGDRMLVDDLAKAKGFKYRVNFNLSYRETPIFKPGTSVTYNFDVKHILLSTPWVAVDPKPIPKKKP